MSDGGKGSAPRPFSVAHDEYSKRWDAIFQRDLPKEKFEVNSPDPDERDWYYDDHGVKRKKPMGD